MTLRLCALLAAVLRVGVPLTALIAITTAWMARWMWLGGPLYSS